MISDLSIKLREFGAVFHLSGVGRVANDKDTAGTNTTVAGTTGTGAGLGYVDHGAADAGDAGMPGMPNLNELMEPKELLSSGGLAAAGVIGVLGGRWPRLEWAVTYAGRFAQSGQRRERR